MYSYDVICQLCKTNPNKKELFQWKGIRKPTFFSWNLEKNAINGYCRKNSKVLKLLRGFYRLYLRETYSNNVAETQISGSEWASERMSEASSEEQVNEWAVLVNEQTIG